MIKTFGAENYGCLKKVEATLTPLHAFIGPNDSGKSTLLHGMRSLVQFAGQQFDRQGPGAFPFDPFPFNREPTAPKPDPFIESSLTCSTPAGAYTIIWGAGKTLERVTTPPGNDQWTNDRPW